MTDSRYWQPTKREEFLLAERLPLVNFYTSNIEKFLQARLVFELSGIALHHFRSRTEAYEESYEGGTVALLTRAIRQIKDTIGGGSIFFVEDTSVRIEALSTSSSDVPGLSVKEWFRGITFAELDTQLRKSKTKSRRAVVKSDIALTFPGLAAPIFFHGETAGEIADSPPKFKASRTYPWLTSKTFNGWFIPDGAKKRLGEMEIRESWPHDFRIQSLEKLVDRLAEYTAVFNSGAHSFPYTPQTADTSQLQLFAREQSSFIIVGKTCAGKTTLGEYLRSVHGYEHIEASDILPSIEPETMKSKNRFAAASSILEKYGKDIIAQKIISLYGDKLSHGVVITGFRLIQELEAIRKLYPTMKVIFVDASDRVRFARYLNRESNSSIKTFPEFKLHDRQQWSLGLLRVGEQCADIKVENEESLESFHKRVVAILSGKGDVSGISYHLHPRHQRERDQTYRCLAILRDAGRPQSCDEIEDETPNSGVKILHNNVNKVLKAVPELAKRIESKGMRVRYHITDNGLAYLNFLEHRGTRDE